MIVLLGVAHVIDLKEKLTAALKEFKPNAIAIELDPDRLRALLEKAQGGNKGPLGRDIPFTMRLWAHMQDRLASQLGDVPGSEMLLALDVSKDLKVPLVLIDDPLSTVAPRLINGLSPKERVLLLVSSVVAFITPSKVVKKELEHYSESREDYVQAMRAQFPTVARVLLDERNVHMAERLKLLSKQFERIAVVLGDAHVAGIESLLKPDNEVQVNHLVGGT
jgi:pheromone shutdown protein TraB